MGLFQQYIDGGIKVSGVKLGQTLRIPLPRDFPREGFIIRADVTRSAVVATLAPEGVHSLFKRVRLSANDGGTQRDLVNADGFSILQRHLHYSGGALDASTSAAHSSGFGAGVTTVRLPHFYAPMSLASPTRDRFLANFPRFNTDPVLEIQIGSQTDVDTNGSPTFAVSDITITIFDLKRVVTLPNWQYLNTEFVAVEKFYASTGANQKYQIPIPGFHFLIGARPYTSATAFGDVSIAGGVFKLQALNIFSHLLELKDLNALNLLAGSAQRGSSEADILASLYAIDFLSDQVGDSVANLDTVLDTNIFTGLGVTPEVIGDITGGAGVKVVYLHDRCFGDISPALAILNTVGKK